jgi:hypothetical protein
VYISGNRRDRLIPAPQVFPPRQEHRIEEHGSIVVTRFDRHQVQDPMPSSKSKVNSIANQDQRPCGQPQRARLRYQFAQYLPKPMPQCLRRETCARREAFQSAPLHQDGFHKAGRTSPTLASSFLSANAPRSFATAALTTSRPEAIDFRSATRRFRVRRIHARELATDSGSRYEKSQPNLV